MYLKLHSRLPTQKCSAGTGGEVGTVISNLMKNRFDAAGVNTLAA